MNIIVDKKNILNSNIIKSKEIICPKCNENIIMYIEDYHIFLYGCKNGHEIDNISFDEYNKTQNFDMSRIKCDECKKNKKSETINNKFYICNKCEMNICPICILNHDKTHNIIDYDNKKYICDIHNESYISYCEKCKKNICKYCENEHNNQELIFFKNIILMI